MADFSKQWCELNDPEMEADFDILEEATHIPPGHYVPLICEGFGFIAIGKDDQDNTLLAMPVDEKNFQWISYDEVIKLN